MYIYIYIYTYTIYVDIYNHVMCVIFVPRPQTPREYWLKGVGRSGPRGGVAPVANTSLSLSLSLSVSLSLSIYIYMYI